MVAGNAEMSKEHLADNIDVIIKRLDEVLERGRMNIGSIYIKTTMGPSERII
jgi:large subunit ribosomal protein L1